jgi:hypothetical protein
LSLGEFFIALVLYQSNVVGTLVVYASAATQCPAAALLQEDEFCDTAKNGRDLPQLLSE